MKSVSLTTLSKRSGKARRSELVSGYLRSHSLVAAGGLGERGEAVRTFDDLQLDQAQRSSCAAPERRQARPRLARPCSGSALAVSFRPVSCPLTAGRDWSRWRYCPSWF